jgi:DNA-binding CsgD family transcriptional regulator
MRQVDRNARVETGRATHPRPKLASLLARVLGELKLPVFVFEATRQLYANEAARELTDRLWRDDRIDLRVVLIDHITAILPPLASTPASSVTLLTSGSGEPFYIHAFQIRRRGARDRTYAVTVRSSGADVVAFRRRYRLSARESQIVELVCRGAANREIARALGITVTTTKKHLGRVFDKVGVDSRAQLMARLG